MKKLAVALLALLWAVPALAQGIGPGPVGMPPGAANAQAVSGYVNALNPKYGIKGDTQSSKACGLTLSGSDPAQVLTMTSCSVFAATDVGKSIVIDAAGGVWAGTIAGYTNGKTITLSSPGPTFGVSSAIAWVYWGTDNSAGLQSAINDAAGGTLYLPPDTVNGGCYGFASTLNLPTSTGIRMTGGMIANNTSNQSGCTLVSLGTMTAMLKRGVASAIPTFQTTLEDMTLDGTGTATSAVEIDQINRCYLRRLFIKGAATNGQGLLMGDGTHNAQGCWVEENSIVVEDNAGGLQNNPWFAASIANAPAYSINNMVGSSDSHYIGNYLLGAKTANLYAGGAGLFILGNHTAGGSGFGPARQFDLEGVLIYMSGSNSCDNEGVNPSDTSPCVYIGASRITVQGLSAQTPDTSSSHRAIELASGVCWVNVSGTNYGPNISDANAIVQDGTACLTTRVHDNAGATYSTIPAKATGILASSGTEVDTTSATEANLAVVGVPAGLLTANGAIRVTCLWSMTASSNVKTMKIRLSSTSGDTSGGTGYISSNSGASTQTSWTMTTIFNTNATNAQAGSTNVSPGPQSNVLQTSTINTANTWYININGLVAAGETLKLIGYTVEVINP